MSDTAIQVRQASVSFAEIERMADRMARSQMFGKTPDQMVALMMIAQAEGQHPAIAAMEYDVIQGRPALKSQAALARFQTAGGRIDWKERTEKAAEATFSHPAGGTLTVRFSIERAQQMGLTGKDNWKKQPSIMLQWRCVAEGIRACYPACLNRMYLVEEVQDFEPVRNVTPAQEPSPAPEQETRPEPAQPSGDPQVLAEIRDLVQELGIDIDTKKRLMTVFGGNLDQILRKLRDMKAEKAAPEPVMEDVVVTSSDATTATLAPSEPNPATLEQNRKDFELALSRARDQIAFIPEPDRPFATKTLEECQSIEQIEQFAAQLVERYGEPELF